MIYFAESSLTIFISSLVFGFLVLHTPKVHPIHGSDMF